MHITCPYCRTEIEITAYRLKWEQCTVKAIGEKPRKAYCADYKKNCYICGKLHKLWFVSKENSIPKTDEDFFLPY